MKDDNIKIKKIDKDKEIIIPTLYPNLIKDYNKNRFNNNSKIFSSLFNSEVSKNEELNLNESESSENFSNKYKYDEDSSIKENLNISKYYIKLQNSRQNSIFKLLFNTNNKELNNQRKIYLKKLVHYNEDVFPQELKLDKLMKKSTNNFLNTKRKSNNNYFENLTRDWQNKNNRGGNKKSINHDKGDMNLNQTKSNKDTINYKINNSNMQVQKNENFNNSKKRLVKKEKDNENDYLGMKRKESCYNERFRRDSMDMFENTKREIIDKHLQNDNKIIHEDESIDEVIQKSDEESLDEFEEDNNSVLDEYGDDNDDDVADYSD
jgi:hypothetical protein